MYQSLNGWLRLVAVVAAFSTILKFSQDLRSGRLRW